MNRPIRRRVFIDLEVQGAIVRRVVLYWFSCVAFTVLPLLIAKAVFEPELLFFQQFGAIARHFWPVYLGLMVILPFAIYDIVRVSHRFVGPVYRIRNELRNFVDGKDPRPIRIRENDFWQEFADEINAAILFSQRTTPEDKDPLDSVC